MSTWTTTSSTARKNVRPSYLKWDNDGRFFHGDFFGGSGIGRNDVGVDIAFKIGEGFLPVSRR